MANSNITVVRSQSQFKDYISAKERLLICGANRDAKNPLVTKLRSSKKSDEAFRRYLSNLKTVLA